MRAQRSLFWPYQLSTVKGSATLRSRRLAIIMLSLMIAVFICLLSPPGASAASTGQLHLSGSSEKQTYRVGEPVYIRWTLTNTGNSQCEASRLSKGTIAVVSVIRDGKRLHPTFFPILYVARLPVDINRHLAMLAPGAS